MKSGLHLEVFTSEFSHDQHCDSDQAQNYFIFSSYHRRIYSILTQPIVFTHATYVIRKRSLCCRPVSVHLSVTWCICMMHMAEDIVKRFVRLSSPITLLWYFLTPCADTQFPSAEKQSTRGWKKIGDFRVKSPFISETVRDRRIINMER